MCRVTVVWTPRWLKILLNICIGLCNHGCLSSGTQLDHVGLHQKCDFMKKWAKMLHIVMPLTPSMFDVMSQMLLRTPRTYPSNCSTQFLIVVYSSRVISVFYNQDTLDPYFSNQCKTTLQAEYLEYDRVYGRPIAIC